MKGEPPEPGVPAPEAIRQKERAFILQWIAHPPRVPRRTDPRPGRGGRLAGPPLPDGDFGRIAREPQRAGIGPKISSLHLERGSGGRGAGPGAWGRIGAPIMPRRNCSATAASSGARKNFPRRSISSPDFTSILRSTTCWFFCRIHWRPIYHRQPLAQSFSAHDQGRSARHDHPGPAHPGAAGL